MERLRLVSVGKEKPRGFDACGFFVPGVIVGGCYAVLSRVVCR
jgi:hypothetical protein